MTDDFSSESRHMELAANTTTGPVTMSERLSLAAVYAPYLLIPLMLVFYMLTAEEYMSSKPSRRSLKQQ